MYNHFFHSLIVNRQETPASDQSVKWCECGGGFSTPVIEYPVLEGGNFSPLFSTCISFSCSLTAARSLRGLDFLLHCSVLYSVVEGDRLGGRGWSPDVLVGIDVPRYIGTGTGRATLSAYTLTSWPLRVPTNIRCRLQTPVGTLRSFTEPRAFPPPVIAACLRSPQK